VLSLVATAVMGVWKFGGLDRPLMIVAAFVYLLGVQAPTITINIPLNNQLQGLDATTVTRRESGRARTSRPAGIDGTSVERGRMSSLPPRPR